MLELGGGEAQEAHIRHYVRHFWGLFGEVHELFGQGDQTFLAHLVLLYSGEGRALPFKFFHLIRFLGISVDFSITSLLWRS